MGFARPIRSRRGGSLLDAVLALGFILVGSFALYHLGLTFSEIVRGASAFFGL